MEDLKSSDLSYDDEKGARIFHDVDFKIAADFVERFEHTREAEFGMDAPLQDIFETWRQRANLQTGR